MSKQFDQFVSMDRRYEDEYRQLVKAGRYRMEASQVVLCGLARNIAGSRLNSAFDRFARLRERFLRVGAVFYENDSTDGTADQLRANCRGWPEAIVVSRNHGDPVWPRSRNMPRAARMAFYREESRQLAIREFPDAEYVIVVDLDLLDWDLDGIANTLGRDGWDAVGSNGIATIRGRQVQFDAWAFRKHGDFTPMHWREVNPLRFLKGQPMLACSSCFGGLCVYRMEAFRSSPYAGGDCEHVGFHRGMADAGFGRVFLNPSQIALY